MEKDTNTTCRLEDYNINYLYARITKVPQMKRKYIHGNKIKRNSTTKDLGLKPNNVNIERFSELNVRDLFRRTKMMFRRVVVSAGIFIVVIIQ